MPITGTSNFRILNNDNIELGKYYFYVFYMEYSNVRTKSNVCYQNYVFWI